MVEPDIEPSFVSVCSTLILEEEIQPVAALRDIAGAGEKVLFPNRRIEIMEGEIKESVVEFSTDELDDPQYGEWNYVIIDLYEDDDPDKFHIHTYVDTDSLDEIDRFYEEIRDIFKTIDINSVQADLFIDKNVSELGFIYEGEEKLLLDGVRFSYDSTDYSLYSVEDGSVIRGGYTEGVDSLDMADYKPFVKTKVEELQTTIRSLPP